MQVVTERIIVDTDNSGNLKQLPTFPPNRRVEAIFILLDELPTDTKPRRRPHPDLVGKTRILGNIMDSVPESDWDQSE